MGFKNAVVWTIGVSVGAWVHVIFNTPFDWLLLWVFGTWVAYVYSDDPLERFYALFRFVHKRRS